MTEGELLHGDNYVRQEMAELRNLFQGDHGRQDRPPGGASQEPRGRQNKSTHGHPQPRCCVTKPTRNRRPSAIIAFEQIPFHIGPAPQARKTARAPGTFQTFPGEPARPLYAFRKRGLLTFCTLRKTPLLTFHTFRRTGPRTFYAFHRRPQKTFQTFHQKAPRTFPTFQEGTLAAGPGPPGRHRHRQPHPNL